MTMRGFARPFPLAVIVALATCACEGGELSEGLAPAHQGSGPVVRFDLFARPLPDVPLPNDIAGRPDPDSYTGQRINASLVADTAVEEDVRSLIDQLDGWGTFAALSVSFDCPNDADGVCIDIDNVIARHQGDDFDFTDDALYVIDITEGSPSFGEPVALEMGEGYFPLTLDRLGNYFNGDPRRDARNTIFEDRDEDLDGDGLVDPGEDTNHDGELGIANVWPPAPEGVDPTSPEYASTGHLLTFYELATNSLIMRPLEPMLPATRYAVVLTSRLVGESGRPVRSPFPFINHVDQTEDLAPLEGIIESDDGSRFGGLGFSDVRFAWSFTTESMHDDLYTIREGLYGRGPAGFLADEFPADLVPAMMAGCNPHGPHPDDCELPLQKYVVKAEVVADLFARVGADIFPLPDDMDLAPTVQSYREYVDYIVLGWFYSPYFKDHDGSCTDMSFDCEEDGEWAVDSATGRFPHGGQRIPFMMTIPKQELKQPQWADRPFPVVLHNHGTGSANLEALGFAGQLAKFGLAVVAIDSVYHGVGQNDVMRRAIEAVFQVEDLAGAGKAIVNDRNKDFDGDGVRDAAGDFWTAYIFNTRDNMRQTAVDWFQLVRILRSFDGSRLAGPVDTDGDGAPDAMHDFDQDGAEEVVGDFDSDGVIDIAGDMDGDGDVDVGGPDVPYFQWGMSLGGIVTTITASHEPYIDAAAPVSVGGGLSDIAIRSVQTGVPESVILRTIGPFVTAVPSEWYYDFDHPSRSETVCGPDAVSLRFVTSSTADKIGDIEFACLSATEAATNNVLVVENHVNGARRCAPLLGLYDVRTNYPSDVLDDLTVTVLSAGGEQAVVDFDRCEPVPGATEIRRIETWENDQEFQWWEWVAGDPLVSPAAGYGQRKNTSSLRRFLGISQVGLERGDPANSGLLMRRYPMDFPEESRSRTNVLEILTIGDMNVPLSTGLTLARAIGTLDVFHDDPRWGMSAGEALLAQHVVEGNEYRDFWIRESDAKSILFDASDLDRGLDGQDMPSFPSEYGQPAMRLWVPTDPSVDPLTCSETWDASSLYLDEVTCAGGLTAMVMAAIDDTGTHSFLLSQPERAFNINLFLINMIGRYFSTGGTSLNMQTCLEDGSCPFTPPPVE